MNGDRPPAGRLVAALVALALAILAPAAGVAASPPETTPDTTPDTTEPPEGGSDGGDETESPAPANEPGEVSIWVWIAAGTLLLVVVVWTVRAAGDRDDDAEPGERAEPPAPGPLG